MFGQWFFAVLLRWAERVKTMVLVSVSRYAEVALPEAAGKSSAESQLNIQEGFPDGFQGIS